MEEKSTDKEGTEQNEGEEEIQQICAEETLTIVEDSVPTTVTAEVVVNECSPCTPPKPTPTLDEDMATAAAADITAVADSGNAADEKVKAFETSGMFPVPLKKRQSSLSLRYWSTERFSLDVRVFTLPLIVKILAVMKYVLYH